MRNSVKRYACRNLGNALFTGSYPSVFINGDYLTSVYRIDNLCRFSIHFLSGIVICLYDKLRSLTAELYGLRYRIKRCGCKAVRKYGYPDI